MEELKKEALKIAENHLVMAIDDVYKLAEVYVKSTETTLDDSLLEGLKLLKGYLVNVADKLDGEER